MFHAWSFKDVIAAIVAFMDRPKDASDQVGATEEVETSDAAERLAYWCYVTGVAVGATLYGVLLNFLIDCYLEKSKGAKRGYFTRQLKQVFGT